MDCLDHLFQTVLIDEPGIEPQDHADPELPFDLDDALRELGEDSRHALLLEVLGGYSCAEIAALLGTTSEDAVMTRPTRASHALRRTIEPG